MNIESRIKLDRFKPRKKKDNSIFNPGDKFSAWIVLKECRIENQNHRHYLCRCRCGIERIINSHSLRSSKSTQCRDCAFKSHGMSYFPIYRVWAGIMSRCYNPNVRIFKYYGGRGIKVCDRWLKFSNFYEDMGERPPGLQIDRVDNDQHYSPENCKWVTSKENNPANKGDLPDNMPGKTFGKWTVLKRVKYKPNHWYYECQCSCGDIHIRAGGELRRGHTTQCRKCKDVSHRGWGERRKKL